MKASAVCVLLAVAVAIVFGQTVRHEFIVCDDEPYVYGNPNVVTGLTADNVRWAMTAYHAGNWHPLTWISHMLDVSIFGIHAEKRLEANAPEAGNSQEPWKGLGAGGHHLTSAILHALSAVVLFLALWQMTGSFWLSALVAAMFAVHPLRVESVAWVAERKDVLSGLFWMLTLLAYGWYARRPDVIRYLMVVIFFALGLSAKSMLMTLPCVLLLLDFWPLRRIVAGTFRVPFALEPPLDEQTSLGRQKADDVYLLQPTAEGVCRLRRMARSPPRFPPQSLEWLVLEKLPLFALSAAVCYVIVKGQQGAGAMSMSDAVPFGLRVANAATSYVMYLWKTVWPVNLAIFYPHPAVMKTVSVSLMIWHAAYAAVVLAAITLAALWSARRQPYLAVGWLWYLGTLVPVIGLIQIGVQGMADRYTYLPTIGIYMAVVWAAAELARRHVFLRVPLVVAATVLLATWTAMAAHQTATWRNSFTVFEHAVEVVPDNFFAHNHLGLAYHNVWEIHHNIADMEKAGAEYKKAVQIAPHYDSANGNLGVYYAGRGEIDKAVEYFRNASRINPYLASFHANLGSAYLVQGKLKEAEAEFRQAVKIDHGNPSFVASLGAACLALGKPGEAESALRQAVRLDRFNPMYHGSLSVALRRQGKDQEALAEYQKTMRLCPNDVVRVNAYMHMLNVSPNDVLLLNDAAWLLATSPNADARNGGTAVNLAARAAELTGGQEPAILSTLAAAYAEAGRFSDAVKTATEAADLALRLGKRLLAESIAAKIPLYRAGSPYHEPPVVPAATLPY